MLVIPQINMNESFNHLMCGSINGETFIFNQDGVMLAGTFVSESTMLDSDGDELLLNIGKFTFTPKSYDDFGVKTQLVNDKNKANDVSVNRYEPYRSNFSLFAI